MDNGTRRKRPFKKTRGGQELTRAQVRQIKKDRKKLRKEMRKNGIKSKREFELTASNMGLYFDGYRGAGLLAWLLHGRALWALLGAAAALLTALFGLSMISQYQGHFTINLDDDMFKNGFVLSETEDFSFPQMELYSDPLENVPCISIASLPEDLDEGEGTHSDGSYFAYTFWLRNEGEDTCDYNYAVRMNSEGQGLSNATWIMFFENGEMTFYAKADENGEAEVIPDYSDRLRGYRDLPNMSKAKYPEAQYEVIRTTSFGSYYRVIPFQFESEDTCVFGSYEGIEPGETNKYTVVMWLEGDDPDCTDDLIGGHLGLEMQFQLVRTSDDTTTTGVVETLKNTLKRLRDSLKFWDVWE